MGLGTDIITMMQADLDSAASDWSATLVCGDDTVTGTASPIGKRDEIDGNGLVGSHDVEFVGKRTSFTTIPTERKVVTLDGTKYSIVSVDDDPACLTLRLSRSTDRTSTMGII